MGNPLPEKKKFNNGGGILKAIMNKIGQRRYFTVRHQIDSSGKVMYQVSNNTFPEPALRHLSIKVNKRLKTIEIVKNFAMETQRIISLEEMTIDEVKEHVLEAVEQMLV